MFQAWEVADSLRSELPGIYRIRDWSQNHANFFRAVKMEKTVMFVILSLIIAVAAFNIISTLVMVVTDKRADIAILRTMGVSPGVIMRTFMVQGAVIGVVGTLVGTILGIILALSVSDVIAWLESLLQIQMLSAEVYFISYIPHIFK